MGHPFLFLNILSWLNCVQMKTLALCYIKMTVLFLISSNKQNVMFPSCSTYTDSILGMTHLLTCNF